jgi:putative two-component system response regulator
MREELFAAAGILIVDDHEPNVLLLESILKPAGYRNYRGITDPRQAVAAFVQFRPDLVLLDLVMPHLDGVSVMRELRSRIADEDYLPILVLTADITAEAKEQALSMGAADFLTKPFDVTEVLLRIRNLLQTRFVTLQLHHQKMILQEKVRERTRELEEAQSEILKRLALAAEYRDDETGRHTQRVGELSALLARAIGLPEDEVELIRQAAPLHDLGKIGVSDSILLKKGRLTDDERSHMETHIAIGGKILSGSRLPLLQLAMDVALYHHENWDGTGHTGIKGEAIPIVGRIVAVADVFDALISERPYKKAWQSADALSEIERLSGSKFDPRLVDAFLRVQHSSEVRRTAL